MKKIISLIVCTMIIIAGFAVFAEVQIRSMQEPPTVSSENQIYFTSNSPSSQETSNIPVMTSEAERYTIRAYQGGIGVFRGTEITPFEVLHIDVTTLPRTDQLLLAHGLQAESRQELNSILEDYES